MATTRPTMRQLSDERRRQARAELEAKGVEFVGETVDTSVCHMATFTDPDRNQLVLHKRYAPYSS